ncbi:MAG TPA: hypothetical protein VJ877_02520 [Bacteroidales bacterium]|nr:hypothetical protein [Bacteroidales bacterium]
MPYRRLPNTDAARIRAMEQALKIGKEIPPFKLAYSSESFVKLQAFLTTFTNTYQLQRQSYNKQVESNKGYQEDLKRAKTYITHFLRVMNMAVQRNDLRSDTPQFFDFNNGHNSLPALHSEKDVIYWGNKIMEGENARMRAGRTPITNPTMAVVKVHFENFMDAYHFQKTMHKKTSEYSEEIAELRKEADKLILKIWNEVEDTFSGMPEEEKRKKSEQYGLVYVFRKNELQKVNDN